MAQKKKSRECSQWDCIMQINLQILTAYFDASHRSTLLVIKMQIKLIIKVHFVIVTITFVLQRMQKKMNQNSNLK